MSKARELANLGNAYSDGALSHRNLIINGAMQVAQRGTSFSGNVYTLDRFKAGNSPTDISQNTSDVPSGFQYSMNLTGANHLINYRMESKDSFRLNGETVTLSFYAKSISGTNTLKVQLGHPSATDDFSIQTVLETSSSITLTSSWARYEVTFSSLSSEIEKGLFFFIYREGSTPSDQTRITGVQLEVGDTATPFEHRSYGDELLRCQRYYRKVKARSADGAFETNSNAVIYGQHPVTMRTSPTVTRLAQASLGTIQGTRVDNGSWFFTTSSIDGWGIAFTCTSTVTDVGLPAGLQNDDVASLDAEL